MYARTVTHPTFLTVTHPTFRWDVCSVEIEVCTIVRMMCEKAGWAIPRVTWWETKPIGATARDLRRSSSRSICATDRGWAVPRVMWRDARASVVGLLLSARCLFYFMASYFFQLFDWYDTRFWARQNAWTKWLKLSCVWSIRQKKVWSTQNAIRRWLRICML